MPKTPSSGFWHQPFLWRLANAHMLVECRCGNCRVVRTYLARDLVKVWGPNAVVGQLFGRCPKCGSRERWREQERLALSEDVGNTVIRRPAGIRHVQLWRDEFYGPPAYGPHEVFGMEAPKLDPD